MLQIKRIFYAWVYCLAASCMASNAFAQSENVLSERRGGDGGWLARAGLFVEPSVTYDTSSSSINYPQPLSNSSGSVNGFGLGAKLGGHIFESVFLGVDGRLGMPTFKDSSTNYEAKAVNANWGPMVGFQMPRLGIRLFGTYILDGSLDPEASGKVDVKFTGAEGYRVGAGFRVAMVSLNLEYQEMRFRKSTLQRVGPFAPDTEFNSVNLNNQSWIASVSFPLEI